MQCGDVVCRRVGNDGVTQYMPTLGTKPKTLEELCFRARAEWPWLKSTASPQARMPILAHNDVVVHGNPQRLGDVDDGLGHLDVGL